MLWCCALFLNLDFIYDFKTSVIQRKPFLSYSFNKNPILNFGSKDKCFFPGEIWTPSFVTVRNTKPNIFLLIVIPGFKFYVWSQFFNYLYLIVRQCVSQSFHMVDCLFHKTASLLTACLNFTIRNLNAIWFAQQ